MHDINKFNDLDDDQVIINELKQVHGSCDELGEIHDRGFLASEGIKIK